MNTQLKESKMSEDKIYLVTSGQYSDYGVDAVFNSRELAQKFIDVFSHGSYNEMRIEERVLNPKEKEIRQGFKPFFVRMTKEGIVKECVIEDSIYGFMGNINHNFDLKDNLYNHVFASSEEHAIKATNELRGMIIAANKWGKRNII